MTDMPDRNVPEMLALAAWLNVSVDQIPPENRAHTNPYTMAAWRRVAEALIEYGALAKDAEMERLRTTARLVLDQADRIEELEAKTAKALVAAAYETAAQYHDYHAQYYRSRPDKAAHEEHARRLRALTPADALAALEQVKAQERERCAKIADACVGNDAKAAGAKDVGEGYDLACDDIAAAIRGESHE